MKLTFYRKLFVKFQIKQIIFPSIFQRKILRNFVELQFSSASVFRSPNSQDGETTNFGHLENLFQPFKIILKTKENVMLDSNA